ncbi:hypothetical protein ACTMTJ_27430 [Phytohabitans sp. LJ34]|uniref:hypothetical protein n=1 Tax=Phytohabitans sp. LJ34 TaxID=3452217 RepID=UPI003F8C9B0D
MTDQLPLLHALTTAAVCAVGLAAAVLLRRRLGRAALLATAGFVVLAVAQVASYLWIDHLAGTLPGAAPEELEDIVNRAAWVRAVSGAVSAAALALLLTALLTGRQPAPEESAVGGRR